VISVANPRRWRDTAFLRAFKAQVRQTRGLNRQFNHTVKAVFKGAATTVIGRGKGMLTIPRRQRPPAASAGCSATSKC
jgi:hypothetical protein